MNVFFFFVHLSFFRKLSSPRAEDMFVVLDTQYTIFPIIYTHNLINLLIAYMITVYYSDLITASHIVKIVNVRVNLFNLFLSLS